MDQSILTNVKETLQKAADEMGIELISVRHYVDGEMGPVLEVLIDKDYQIDMDTIQAYTDKVNPLLDEIPELDEAYMLDISSGGSVREIPTKDLPKLIDHYLDIKMKASGETITAKLVSCDEQAMQVLYFIKGRKKNQSIAYDEVETIHMGYKA